MQPTKEWIKKWEKVKDKLQPNSNLVNYFTLKEIAGKEIDVMDIGPCSIPTGEFLVGDPLVYLGSKYEKEYFQKIPLQKRIDFFIMNYIIFLYKLNNKN